jgi:formiminotetrahydrofolate cyclodeaminase
VRIDEQTIGAFLTSLGAKTPTPGGGAVASLTAAIGAALGRMVVRYSAGKKKLAEHDALHVEALEKLETYGTRALELAEADAEAYGRLNELWKLDRDDERRRREFPDAVRAAIDAPRGVVELSLDLLRLCDRLCGRSSRMLASDLAIAAVLAEAAAASAAWNVRINLPLLDDADEAARRESQTTTSLDEAARLRAAVEAACAAAE